jgi:hypothetical protein
VKTLPLLFLAAFLGCAGVRVQEQEPLGTESACHACDDRDATLVRAEIECPVYERPSIKSKIIAHLEPGDGYGTKPAAARKWVQIGRGFALDNCFEESELYESTRELPPPRAEKKKRVKR